MLNTTEIAGRIQRSLELSIAPIAISFSEVAPTGVPPYTGHAPAGCVFWEEAAGGPFSTATQDHSLCAVGVYTHNLNGASPSYASELQEVLQVMSGLEYAREQDVALIPVLEKSPRYVTYAPLAATPAPPDVVLIFADARQGLVLAEAAQQADGGCPPALGRPACAVVAQAYNSGRAAVSFGCCGARAYTDALDAGIALWALPGPRIDLYDERIAKLAEANRVLTRFHQIRKADVAAGGSPSFAESLEKLGG